MHFTTTLVALVAGLSGIAAATPVADHPSGTIAKRQDIPPFSFHVYNDYQCTVGDETNDPPLVIHNGAHFPNACYPIHYADGDHPQSSLSDNRDAQNNGVTVTFYSDDSCGSSIWIDSGDTACYGTSNHINANSFQVNQGTIGTPIVEPTWATSAPPSVARRTAAPIADPSSVQNNNTVIGPVKARDATAITRLEERQDVTWSWQLYNDPACTAADDTNIPITSDHYLTNTCYPTSTDTNPLSSRSDNSDPINNAISANYYSDQECQDLIWVDGGDTQCYATSNGLVARSVIVNQGPG